MRRKFFIAGIFLLILILLSQTNGATNARAESATTTGSTAAEELSQSQKDLEALKKQISDKNAEIAKIQEEIDKYKKQIEQTGQQATTLKNLIKTLETTKAKLNADIQLTTKKIQTTNLNIERLSLAISDKKESIVHGLETLGEALQKVNEIDVRSPVEMILANESFYDGWNDLEDLQKFQGSVQNQLDLLKSLKKELEDDKAQTEKEKKNLTSLKSQLSNQQKVVAQNQQEKNKLLTETKNKESEYQKILASRLAQKQQLEQEILDFESRLKATVDSSLLPKVGSGVLSWPFNGAFMDSCTQRKSVFGNLFCLTQYFGKTAFATKNPQVYNGSGHNGIDFGAVTGTPVKSAADGTVTDTGNTDTSCYGVSYGKWVLIKHYNGLSTLYAHLSVISVSAGESVSSGETIGYSGNTGYTTGPHLHFTVYASQAVHVSGPTEYKSKVCKTYMKLPLAPLNGYLNPLSYL